MQNLTIALPKGRLLTPVVSLLEQIGLNCSCVLEASRELILDNNEGYRFLLVKPIDLPTYVERRVADIGIIGKDVLLEQEKELYELADLKIGHCRMVLAGPAVKESPPWVNLKCVATSYPVITDKFFRCRGKQVEVIKLHGSVELAPHFLLADAIVDLVETGATLKANNLVEWELVTNSTARLVANRSSYHFKGNEISRLLSSLKEVRHGKDKNIF
ncbi:MAG: ATP phosphoribosyltransferase [Firmicutes bacterium]|nr:ATP phosphoribosyltransferase [Bacillota bacterium]